jgi:hypothetical protein
MPMAGFHKAPLNGGQWPANSAWMVSEKASCRDTSLLERCPKRPSEESVVVAHQVGIAVKG